MTLRRECGAEHNEELRVLEVRDLHVVYEGVIPACRGVGLSVPRQGIVALLGANGAGKTSTLRAITGLLDVRRGRITGGSVRVNSAVLTGADPSRIVAAGVSQVMAGRRVFAELTVAENLRAGAHTSKRASIAGNLDRVFEMFPLLADRRRGQAGLLSGGEQQMLAIGMALMAEPTYLLLDEPSSGLAPRVVEQIRDVIVTINAAGTGVLLIEQNAAMALSIATHGYVLEHGRVVLDAPAAELATTSDIREFSSGLGAAGRQSFRDLKRYKRRKRWTA